MTFKVIQGHRKSNYRFLLSLSSNYDSMLHCFRDVCYSGSTWPCMILTSFE